MFRWIKHQYDKNCRTYSSFQYHSDIDILAQEIARLSHMLKVNGIKHKVRLPTWLMNPTVMRYFNFLDVDNTTKAKPNPLPYNEPDINLGKRSN